MPEQLSACEVTRRWLSSRRDGQAHPDIAAQGHLDRCAACTAWGASLDAVTRRVRLTSAVTPDVVGPALAAWARTASSPARTWAWGTGRVVLAVSGAAGIVTGMLGLLDVFGYLDQTGLHLGWELYSFEIALALGFLLAAHRPERYVRALLPLTVAVVVFTLVPAAAAWTAASADLLREASHVLTLAGLVGLLLVFDSWQRRRDHGKPAAVA